jgi:hypothetical protein
MLTVRFDFAVSVAAGDLVGPKTKVSLNGREAAPQNWRCTGIVALALIRVMVPLVL